MSESSGSWRTFDVNEALDRMSAQFAAAGLVHEDIAATAFADDEPTEPASAYPPADIW